MCGASGPHLRIVEEVVDFVRSKPMVIGYVVDGDALPHVVDAPVPGIEIENDRPVGLIIDLHAISDEGLGNRVTEEGVRPVISGVAEDETGVSAQGLVGKERIEDRLAAVLLAGVYGKGFLGLVARPSAVNLYPHILGEFQAAVGAVELDVCGSFPVPGEVVAIPLDIDAELSAPEMVRVEGYGNRRQGEPVIDEVCLSYHIAGQKAFGDGEGSHHGCGLDVDGDTRAGIPLGDGAVRG